MSKRKRYLLSEASERLGVQKSFIARCIRFHWIHPAEPGQGILDEEDLARIRLIQELREEFGANEEAIPIILHLLDQLYSIRRRLTTAGTHSNLERSH